MLERLTWGSAHIAWPGLSPEKRGGVPRRMPVAIRKVAVAVIGGAVLIFGLALIVLPGPAIVVVPLGLAILAKEFPWARKVLDKIKQPLWWLKDHALQVFRKIGHAVGARTRVLRPE